MEAPDLVTRAARHQALGDQVRLALVDELARSDRSPSELARQCDLPTNLLAHHLGVLERVGLVERFVSSGDRRRRYVRLRRSALDGLALGQAPAAGEALFICTHNSARSQLAATLWRARTGLAATSAGTRPADEVHPGARAAAIRHGLDLDHAEPRRYESRQADRAAVVITVCDQAHEELAPPPHWLHWSVPDPVDDASSSAFDAVVESLDRRIATVAPSSAAR